MTDSVFEGIWHVKLEDGGEKNWGTIFADLVNTGEYIANSGQKLPISWSLNGQNFIINIFNGSGTMTLNGVLDGDTGHGLITETPPATNGPSVFDFKMTR